MNPEIRLTTGFRQNKKEKKSKEMTPPVNGAAKTDQYLFNAATVRVG